MTPLASNNITDKGVNPCTGCSACAVACPNHCIKIKLDPEGYLTPSITEDNCTHCGICKDVCYKYLDTNLIVSRKSFIDAKVLAVVNNYFEQMSTVSSAGVASSLARYFFSEGRDVCGCVFDVSTDCCFHKVVHFEHELEGLKGSKYLQSSTYEAFSELLGTGKPAIIFGTPCQIYGIRKEIQRRGIEDKFILVDLFCRGIPSYHLWRSYKSFIQRNFKLEDFNIVNFREKSHGWHKFGIRITDFHGREYVQSLYNDLFYYFYLSNTVMSEACYNCKFRHDLSMADIRLGDFWGNKYRDYDEGVSLVTLLTKEGEVAFDSISSRLRYEECSIEDIYESQRIASIPVPEDRVKIISSMINGASLENILLMYKKHL